MKLTVEYIESCKAVDTKLLAMVEEKLEEISALDNEIDPEECFAFEDNDISYDVLKLEETSWEDEGKYQFRNELYQLVAYDKTIKPYACDKSITNYFNCFFDVLVTRSGSYFTDYMYWYDEPVMKFARVKHIPEVVIPEHDEVEMTDVYIVNCKACDKLNEAGDACKIYGNNPKVATANCATDGFKEYFVKIE